MSREYTIIIELDGDRSPAEVARMTRVALDMMEMKPLSVRYTVIDTILWVGEHEKAEDIAIGSPRHRDILRRAGYGP